MPRRRTESQGVCFWIRSTTSGRVCRWQMDSCARPSAAGPSPRCCWNWGWRPRRPCWPARAPARSPDPSRWRRPDARSGPTWFCRWGRSAMKTWGCRKSLRPNWGSCDAPARRALRPPCPGDCNFAGRVPSEPAATSQKRDETTWADQNANERRETIQVRPNHKNRIADSWFHSRQYQHDIWIKNWILTRLQT